MAEAALTWKSTWQHALSHGCESFGKQISNFLVAKPDGDGPAWRLA
jgi:hypothetical protein